MKGLFSLSYLGPVLYYRDLIQCSEVFFEVQESWQKQSYRNRCYIDGPNGTLMLNIPIVHKGSKQLYKDVQISYHDNWAAKHWQAIQTTYNASPFFDVLGLDLKEVLDQRIPKLMDLNLELNRLLLHWMRFKPTINLTEDWRPVYEEGKDYREVHHPKKERHIKLPSYPQVFDTKYGFRQNLSVIDLLFNEGPAAFDYLGLSLDK